MNTRIKHVHFVGIGGCGMSGIAEILHVEGFIITGSDMSKSSVTDHLENLGIKIFIGHSKHNITGAGVVVYSSAVGMDNPEIQCAFEHNVPVIKRAEMLGELMRMKYSVGVSGTHGKTSTTSMIGSIMLRGNIDPTIIVGGITKNIGTGAVSGKSKYLVAEADEFDRSFLKMPPTIAVITTVESDHLDCYDGLDDIKAAFVQYANQVPFYGSIILCLDEKSIQEIIPELKKNIISYGFSAQAEYRIVNRRFTKIGTNFEIEYKGKNLGEIELNHPGDHNVKNATASVAVCLEIGMPFDVIAESLKSFGGVRRRFEIKGEKNDVIVVDDYAHHPTEIIASLDGAKSSYNRNIIAIFQPHLFSRTRDLAKEFGSSFFNADILIVTDIYPAREKPIEGITGKLIAEEAIKHGHGKVKYIQDKSEIAKYVKSKIKKGDLVITLGAGDIWKTGETILGEL